MRLTIVPAVLFATATLAVTFPRHCNGTLAMLPLPEKVGPTWSVNSTYFRQIVGATKKKSLKEYATVAEYVNDIVLPECALSPVCCSGAGLKVVKSRTTEEGYQGFLFASVVTQYDFENTDDGLTDGVAVASYAQNID